MAKPATMATRVEISVSDTRDGTVVGVEPSSLSLRSQAWGIPMMTVAFLIVMVVLGATVWPIERYETAPGQQLQIDFGSTVAFVDEQPLRIHLFVATLGYSRRCFVTAFLHERQSAWLQGLEGALKSLTNLLHP